MWRSDIGASKAQKPASVHCKRKIKHEDDEFTTVNGKLSTTGSIYTYPTVVDLTEDDDPVIALSPAPPAKRACLPERQHSATDYNVEPAVPSPRPSTPTTCRTTPFVDTASLDSLAPTLIITPLRNSLPPSLSKPSNSLHSTRLSAPPVLRTPIKPTILTEESPSSSPQTPCPATNHASDSMSVDSEENSAQPSAATYLANPFITPNATPSQPCRAEPATLERSLYDIPPFPARYTPKVSTLDGVEYTNPKKFCLKPPYWKRWSPKMYSDMAEYVRSQVDPVQFAREHNVTVDETQHVLSSLIVNPLYDAKEAAKRGEEGVLEIFELVNKYGTQPRKWGHPRAKDGKRLTGELMEGYPGAVSLLVSTNPPRDWHLKVEEMVEEDREYLKRMLPQEQWQMLWPEV